jgi:hypothetical protein
MLYRIIMLSTFCFSLCKNLVIGEWNNCVVLCVFAYLILIAKRRKKGSYEVGERADGEIYKDTSK